MHKKLQQTTICSCSAHFLPFHIPVPVNIFLCAFSLLVSFYKMETCAYLRNSFSLTIIPIPSFLHSLYPYVTLFFLFLQLLPNQTSKHECYLCPSHTNIGTQQPLSRLRTHPLTWIQYSLSLSLLHTLVNINRLFHPRLYTSVQQPLFSTYTLQPIYTHCVACIHQYTLTFFLYHNRINTTSVTRKIRQMSLKVAQKWFH